jgi:FdhD protein
MERIATRKISVTRVTAHSREQADDMLAIEEPLEITVCYWAAETLVKKQMAITMRTPGNDEELALGFLFSEGVITTINEISKIESLEKNKIVITLNTDAKPNLERTERNFYTTSSCGVCGKTSIDSIRILSATRLDEPKVFVDQQIFTRLETQLIEQQHIFSQTGGLHSSALFDLHGNLIELREDVGRHNGLDKLIGSAFIKSTLPLSERILFLSGRASFELIQKASMAGIRIVAAVGAPSSLAVELAEEMNMTLIGFLRNERFNIYSGIERLALPVSV